MAFWNRKREAPQEQPKQPFIRSEDEARFSSNPDRPADKPPVQSERGERQSFSPAETVSASEKEELRATLGDLQFDLLQLGATNEGVQRLNQQIDDLLDPNSGKQIDKGKVAAIREEVDSLTHAMNDIDKAA